MTEKWTKGPWHVGMKPGPMIYGPLGEQIADMTADLIERDEKTANARLIAAAPELYRELLDAISLLKAYTTGKTNNTTRGQALASIRAATAALTKARGGVEP